MTPPIGTSTYDRDAYSRYLSFFQVFFIVRHHTFAHAIISNSLMATALLLLGFAAVAVFSKTRQAR